MSGSFFKQRTTQHIKRNYSQFLNIFLFAFQLWYVLSIPAEPPVWKGFSDTYDYLYQSMIPATSMDFYFPERTESFYPRPFTYPLVYKLAGSDPGKIIFVQKIILCISTLVFIISIISFFRLQIIRSIVTIGMYLIMIWWNTTGWTILLLSESISNSLLILWLASFLFFIKKRGNFNLILHVIITLFFSFTRDSWPYIIILFYLAGMVYFVWITKDGYLFVRSLYLIAFGMAILILQQHSAHIGKRYQMPVLNSICIRILPNEHYSQWFLQRGMPEIPSLIGKFRNDSLAYTDQQFILYSIYKDEQYQQFYDWIDHDGKRLYSLFLLTHPKYTFFFEETSGQRKRILAYNLPYAGEPRGFKLGNNQLLPFIPFWLFVVIIMGITYLFIRNPGNIFFFFLLQITLAFCCNVLLCYNADALEVERHMFITNIMIQILGLIGICAIIEELAYRFSKTGNK
jgi:hypothetical protein